MQRDSKEFGTQFSANQFIYYYLYGFSSLSEEIRVTYNRDRTIVSQTTVFIRHIRHMY